jgi:protein SCO1/2
MGLAAAVLVAVASGGAWFARACLEAGRGGGGETVARALVPFRLVERSGREVDREALRGRILVVNFVFTGCSISCYEVSRRMSELQTYVAGKPGVRLLSVSVDPRTDTPEVLTAFADRLKADPERWWFLTGDKADVYRLIETSFLAKAPAEAPSLIPGNFDRAERIVLVDGDGRVRRYYDGMKPDVVGKVLDGIVALEQGKEPR